MTSLINRWRLFILLLSQMIFVHSEVTWQQLVLTTVRENVTPLCSNDTESTIVFIICRISTESSGGEECHLIYELQRGFENRCDSRFRLMTENQTVFLHLSSLTSDDSGNYTCECSHTAGTDTFNLNITVEGVEEDDVFSPPGIPFLSVVIGVIIFVIITLIILLFIYRKTHHRRSYEPETTTVPPDTEPEDIEPYSIFLQRENGLYSLSKIRSVKTNVFYRDVHTETSV